MCISIDNGSNNAVGGRDYSSYQAVGKFTEYGQLRCMHGDVCVEAGHAC